MHPDKVNPRRVEGSDDELVYDYTDKDGHTRTFPRSHVMHLRGPSDDGVIGLNPIELHNTTARTGLAQSDFTQRFYENDATPGGWITHPGKFANERDREAFRNSWQAAQTGKNRHKTAVLEHGMEYHALDMKMTDAQFIESKQFTNHDIARIFRVPPHKLGELERATHSNIEQHAIEFKQDTILPWATRIERRLSLELLSTDEQAEHFFEFAMEGLERGDSESRALFYHHAVSDGWMTRNEVRTRENLNRLDGLDEPLTPMNMERTGDEQDDTADDRARAALEYNVGACIRTEAQTLRALTAKHEGDERNEKLCAFWASFAKRLVLSLGLSKTQAAAYVEGSANCIGNLSHWETDNMPRLLRLVEEIE